MPVVLPPRLPDLVLEETWSLVTHYGQENLCEVYGVQTSNGVRGCLHSSNITIMVCTPAKRFAHICGVLHTFSEVYNP